MDGLKYIELDGKRPTHKFKDGIGARTWDQVRDCDDVAVIVPDGYVVLDFDTKSDAAAMRSIIEGEGLQCRVVKTTRGIHAWFKADEESPKNFIKQRLAVGLYCDRKAGGRNAYVKIKQDGAMRQVIKDVPLEDCQTVPAWLAPVSCPRDRFAFKEMGEGSGRNQELYNYIVYLQSKELGTHEDIRDCIRVINDYVLAEPLTDSEVATICREEAFKPADAMAAQIEEAKQRKGFSHNEFGDQLIEEFHIIELNGTLYVYEDGYYQADDRIIEQKMLELYPSIKQRDRSEVLAYIRIAQHVGGGKIESNPYVVNLENTRLDIRNGSCLPFTPNAYEFQRIPAQYDPGAYCADLDKLLNRVFCGDRELINMFEELVGSMLIRHARYQKAALFFGSGSNGKSTILNLLRRFLGEGNYSAIALERVCDRFNTAELENKLANIGDDVDNVSIRDTGTLKKLFSGNAILVEKKGERPYTIEPYATHVYSCNAIPRSIDKSDGFYRRWLLVPFRAKFSPTDPDYDPLIEDKLETPEAMSYMLNLAIRGAQRLMRNGRFTEPASVREALEEYKSENSTVLTWLDDAAIGAEQLLAEPKDKIYSDFRDWCKLSGVTERGTTGKKAFYREIIAKFGFDDKAVQRHNGKRYFSYSLDD